MRVTPLAERARLIRTPAGKCQIDDRFEGATRLLSGILKGIHAQKPLVKSLNCVEVHQKPFNIVILLVSLSAITIQNPIVVADEAATVQKRISDSLQTLKSADFQSRLRAVADLSRIGQPAAAPVREALKSATGEERQLLERVLRAVSKNTFASRLEELQKTQSPKLATGMPEWKRFSTVVGKGDAEIRYFARLMASEPELFTVAADAMEDAQAGRSLSILLEKRANQLMQTTVQGRVTPESFDTDSYAALLLLAGNERIRLRRNTSTVLSAMLRLLARPGFRKVHNHSRVLRLAGSYFQRGQIGVSTPLEVARQLKMPEGLALARAVLGRSNLRGLDGFHAMLLIRDMGDKSDLPLLESIFDNRDPLFLNRDLNFASYNGDLALAVAILLRDRNPADFGFPGTKRPASEYRLVTETTGFTDEESRAAARKRYREQFLKNSPLENANN